DVDDLRFDGRGVQRGRQGLSVVVLAISPTRLPPRSVTPRTPGATVARRLAPSTKIMWLKATCSMRPKVIVVDPHSRSMVPFTSLLTRSAGVAGTQLIFRSASFSDCLMAAAT